MGRFSLLLCVVGVMSVSSVAQLAAFVFLALQFNSALADQVEMSWSPDRSVRYECGDEADSSIGCFNTWVLTEGSVSDASMDGHWRPVKCINPSMSSDGGLCYQGGVAWWYWKRGDLGDPILFDFVHRDYAGPMIDGRWRNDTPKGDARLDRNRDSCYVAMKQTYCMVPMQ